MRRGLENTKKEIILIYSCHEKKPGNIVKEHPRLYSKARKYFGSWKNALETCGINYDTARNSNNWSREKIVEKIRELVNDGQSLRPSDLRGNKSVRLMSAASYHFGSWSKAVSHAGIDYEYGRKKKERIQSV